MRKFDYGTVVVGGGAAGITSAIWSASLGSKTLIVEKEDRLGGDCLHYGCVPSKSLIKSAYVYNLIKKAGEYGLPEIPAPQVDFSKITGRIQSIIGSIQDHDSPEFFKERYNIDTKFGSPVFLDKNTIEAGGEKVTSKKIILATGSSGRIPPVTGISDVPYITNTDVFSLEKLPASIIVLGGGPIGLEMAQSFRRLGSEVTVIEFGGAVLPKEDPDVSRYIKGMLEKEGLRISVNSKAVKAEMSGDLIKLTFERNGAAEAIEAETLLISAGREPNITGMDLEAAGVKYLPHGIKVNRRLQTTSKNIFACGDCRVGYQFTHVAEYDARIASLNAFLPVPLLKTDYSNVPWCTYLDPEVASVGYNEAMAKKAGVEYDVYRYDFSDVDRALAESAPEGFIKILVNKKRKLIGVQIIGLHAGELIHEWVPAINSGIDIGKIERSIHIYPTLSRINKKVSGRYLASQNNLVKIAAYLFK